PKMLHRISIPFVLLCFLALLLLHTESLASAHTCPKDCQCKVLSDDTIETDCQSQGLTRIPQGLSNRTSKLFLQANKIASIPDGAFEPGLNRLTDLYLNGNGLSLLGNESLRGLSSLRRLYLSQNRLASLPQVCQFAPKLQRLILDNNQINNEVFPDSYLHCAELTVVSLSGNQWLTLSRKVFANLKNSKDLSSLKMSSVSLRYIENTTLTDLAQTLRNLDLSGNSVTGENLIELFQSTKFSYRFISLFLRASAGLTRLSADLLPAGRLPRLSLLDLANCPGLLHIEDGALAGVGGYLTDLILDGSSISHLSPQTLAGLDKLRRLSMAATPLTGWAGPMPAKLVQLDVSSSRLTTIGGTDGASVNPLPMLLQFNGRNFEWLKAAGNPFRCDCELAWLRLALHNSGVRERIPDLTRWLCAGPPQLAGQSVFNFTLPDDCSGSSAATASSIQPTSQSASSIVTSSVSYPSSQSASSIVTSSVSYASSQSDSTVSVTTSYSAPESHELSLILIVSLSCGVFLVIVLLLIVIIVVRRRCCSFRIIRYKARGDSAGSQATIDSEMIEA
ncbi:hypothetical protein BOX15_Mlig007958g1, partial [Macrostomum lignano]